MYRKSVALGVLCLLVGTIFVQQASAGKLKKIAAALILAKALSPKIIPIPLLSHGGHGGGHGHDPWAQGGHGGGIGFSLGHGIDLGSLPGIHLGNLPSQLLGGLGSLGGIGINLGHGGGGGGYGGGHGW